MNQSKRIFYFDALRALAIIGIVFCHASVAFVITGINRSDFYISAFFDCFRDFSIPVFVMLSGALLVNRRDNLKAFFKKRLSRIFIPFLFWVVVYIIYSSIHITNGFNLGSSIDIFLGTSSTLGVAFWFIWMIMIAYIGIFIINKVICRYEKYDAEIINILAMVSLVYIALVDWGLFSPYSSKILYYISFMSYIMIGYFLANNNYLESKISKNKLVVITAVLFVCSYLFYIFSFVVPRSQAHGQFITLGYFNLKILFISVSFFLMFKFLSKTDYMTKLEDSSSGKILTYVSSYSFGIYLSHYMILHYLKNNLLKGINYAQQSPLIWIPLFVILTLIISLVVLALLNKIPYIGEVSGSS